MQIIDAHEIVIRLAAAAGIGALIGLNREITQKPAGMRTHALVSLGAALITLVSVQFAAEATPREDGAVLRTIQGVVTGIGFIGGGVILRLPQEQAVRGLTTAATIWIVAGLGIACGFGAWRAAAVTAGLALVILIVGNWIERFVHRVTDTPEAPGRFARRRTDPGFVPPRDAPTR